MKHIKKFNEDNSVSGLVFGIDGEIVQLSKYQKNWHKMFDEHNLDKKYKTKENYEHFCYLNYMGIDAESVFFDKIKELMNEK